MRRLIQVQPCMYYPFRNLKLKLALVFVLAFFAHISYSQGKLMNKLVSKLAKSNMIGNANVLSTSSLDSIVISGGIVSNLHSVELGTLAQSFFGDWKTGGDQVGFTFFKRNTTKFYKIDGTVTIDATPVEYMTAGTYSLISNANASSRKVEITTRTGEKSSFTISPSKQVFKIISINGQKDNISLDPTKDVTIEVDGIVGSENQLMKVSLAVNQIGMKSFIDVCFIRAGSKLVIPAAAFRNMYFVPAGKAVYNYKNSFLSVAVERIESATEVSGNIPIVQYTSSYSDGKFVTISNEPNLNMGLTITGTEANMNYDFFKPNAFLSRPSSQIKKFGVLSFSIRGTTYQQSSSSSSTSVSKMNPFGGVTSSTTVATATWTTEIPWESLLEKMYPEFVAIVESEFNASAIPIDKITSSEAYKSIVPVSYDDASTTVDVVKAYRNTKVISAFMPVAEGFGANGVNQRIMNETGGDALMTLTIDLETKGGSVIEMTPKFAFEILGKTNGTTTNTKYIMGNINSTTGFVFTKKITPEELEAIVRKSDLLNVFRKGLKEIIAKEKANSDYEMVWGLQK